MEDSNNIAIVTIVLIVVILIITFIVYENSNKKSAYQLKLWNDYQEALKSGDKAKVLNAGRIYYSSLRAGGRLTIYDEQALTNDLNVMKETN